MAKGMMKENQQSSVQQGLEKLFLSTTGTGRGGENRELHRVGAGESSASTATDPNTSFAIPSIVEGKIEEKVDQKLVETPGYLHASSKFAIFPCNTVISDLLLGSCQFSSLVLCDCHLKFSEQKEKLNYFDSFQSCPKGM